MACRLLRSALNKKKKRTNGQIINDLPDGKDCTFVPYGGDDKDQVTTQERQHSFGKVRDRQRQFLKRTTYSDVIGVLELDFPLESYDTLSSSETRTLSLTLRQVLCAMKSYADKTRSIFKGIDVK